jgi:hypothetical protein
MADTRAQDGTGRPSGNEWPGSDHGPGTGGAESGGLTAVSTAPRQAMWRRHDPRIDAPTKEDRRKLRRWAILLAFCPICLCVVVWAALEMNGNYPTVKPPVPAGWQSVAGIYASFSVPASWSLKNFMSDVAGDIYYSGPGGGIGESVTPADTAPAPDRSPPTIVGTFLGWKYQVSSVTATRIANATAAWRYRFHLANGTTATALLAWVRPTQSVVWLVASRDSPITEKAISTLTLAS